MLKEEEVQGRPTWITGPNDGPGKDRLTEQRVSLEVCCGWGLGEMERRRSGGQVVKGGWGRRVETSVEEVK